MISQYDDLSGKDADVQNFLKMIKEKNSEKGMEGMLEKMSPTGKRVDNFLGGQMMARNFNNPAGLPQDLYEATMRQYGRKEFGPYTTDDMKLIIEANKKGLI